MEPMTWQDLTVILGLIINFGGGVWWASKITTKQDQQVMAIQKLDKELEKRDARIDAAWKKLDRHENRLTVVETKIKIHNHEDEA